MLITVTDLRGSVVLFPILVRQITRVFFEYAREVTLGRKAQIKANCHGRFIGISEKAFALFDFFFEYEIYQVFACLFLKLYGKARTAYKERFCNLIRRYRF